MKLQKDEENKESPFSPFDEFAFESYQQLLKDRTILFNGDVKDNIIERIVLPLTTLSQKSIKPIKLLINSPGGQVPEGQAVVDAIISSRCQIITVAFGQAMSAAFDIYLAGDYRVCYPNTQLMMHSGSTLLGSRTLPAVNVEADLHKQLFERWASWYAGRTKIAKKDWLDMLGTGLDKYWFPEEALKLGICHEVIQPVNKSTKNIKKYKF
jgi:ATP-dependent Clp endopeptidase proteolytic subunit ClpP